MVLKRRPSSHVVCIDPKKKPIPKKFQSKADLIQELKALKSLHEALEKENIDNVETILKLKKDLQTLKPKVTVHTELKMVICCFVKNVNSLQKLFMSWKSM